MSAGGAGTSVDASTALAPSRPSNGMVLLATRGVAAAVWRRGAGTPSRV